MSKIKLPLYEPWHRTLGKSFKPLPCVFDGAEPFRFPKAIILENMYINLENVLNIVLHDTSGIILYKDGKEISLAEKAVNHMREVLVIAALYNENPKKRNVPTMIRLPQLVVRGQPLSVDWTRDVVLALRALCPIAGNGVRLEETPNGVRINATAKAVQQTANSEVAAEKPEPFELRIRSATEEGNTTPVFYVDVYSPGGTTVVFNASTPELERFSLSDKLGKKDEGWYQVGKAEDLLANGSAICAIWKTSSDNAPELSIETKSEAQAVNAKGCISIGTLAFNDDKYTVENIRTELLEESFPARLSFCIVREGGISSEAAFPGYEVSPMDVKADDTLFLASPYGCEIRMGGTIVFFQDIAMPYPVDQNGKAALATRLPCVSYPANLIDAWLPPPTP